MLSVKSNLLGLKTKSTTMTIFTRASIVPKNMKQKILFEDVLIPVVKVDRSCRAPPPGAAAAAASAPASAPPLAPAFRSKRFTCFNIIAVICNLMNILLLSFMLLSICFVMYHQYSRFYTGHQYKGFCTIPIDLKMEMVEANNRLMPLQWSTVPDVQIFSATDLAAPDQLKNVLSEEVYIDNMIEKITVRNSHHQVEFIHNFANNVTNIVDKERCFVTDLDPNLVLFPESFIMSIESGGKFEVSRVRSSLRGVLPAVRDMATLPEACLTRPTYRLRRNDRRVEKRSVDMPSYDYMHFSGKHVHEIEIGNMEEILQYEKNKTA